MQTNYNNNNNDLIYNVDSVEEVSSWTHGGHRDGLSVSDRS